MIIRNGHAVLWEGVIIYMGLHNCCNTDARWSILKTTDILRVCLCMFGWTFRLAQLSKRRWNTENLMFSIYKEYECNYSPRTPSWWVYHASILISKTSYVRSWSTNPMLKWTHHTASEVQLLISSCWSDDVFTHHVLSISAIHTGAEMGPSEHGWIMHCLTHTILSDLVTRQRVI